ncbi:MAG: U32 family peptidase, partial [Acholeplasmatales bacterium]|nr:U32 family peptidase [Acholeplasmatales bacterium]
MNQNTLNNPPKIELLLPSGNFIHAKIALNNGADAVYLGYKRFNARGTTLNFTFEEIKEIVYYAHIRNKKVYITLNTLIYDTEIEEFKILIDELVSIYVDAFIIQDLGVLHYIHSVYPNVILHASTQMNVKNIDEALFLFNNGISRIILAREVNLELVKEIKKAIPKLEIEVFVHGALCISYSGCC